MIGFNWIWIALLVAGCSYWTIGVILAFRMMRIIRPIDDYDLPEPPQWPKVSIIISALNEADTIEDAIKTKLNSDYPDFEIIIVNDRSTDGTREIIDRVATTDDRIKVIHIEELPDGWLGKPHALSQAVKIATGDFFLFTDADVFISKDLMRKSIAFCENKKIDQLGIGPMVFSNNVLMNTVLLTFFRTFFLGTRGWAIDMPKFRPFSGIGAYNLVRRSAFESTEGFEWLKCEIADDAGLAMMIQLAGGKVWVVLGLENLVVTWYPSLKEMAVGMERGSFATVGNFTLTGTISMALLMLTIELSPLLSLMMVGMPWLQWFGLFNVVFGLIGVISLAAWMKCPVHAALLWPIGSVIFLSMWIRGGWLGWRRGGLIWRDTFYSKEMLKKGKRLSLP